MADIIYISNARLSFPHLVEPQVQATPEGKQRITYGADLILEPNAPGWAQFMQEYSKEAAAKWGDVAQQVMQMVNNDRKQRCYGMGNEKIDKKTFKPYSGYAEKVYLTAISNKMPQVIQADGKPVDPGNTMAYQALTRMMYAGCYVNAAVRPWVQDNKHGRGVRCELIAVQFAADGEAFGEGNTDASKFFTPVAVPQAPAAPVMNITGLPGFLGQ